MVFLLASIISSTSIFILFKLAEKYSVSLLPLITINYLVASISGIFILLQTEQFIRYETNWLLFSVLLGFLFIGLFGLIGLSSQKSGITITTLASKMSLIFPVFFSIYWFNEDVSVQKYVGILTAIVAVLLALHKEDISKIKRLPYLLPVFIFLGGGISDSIIKYVQTVLVRGDQMAAFTTFVFITAFIVGVLATLAEGKAIKAQFNKPTILFGILLGAVNFGSLFFILNALEKSRLDSSLVFTLNNMLIVISSALAGKFFFREQLSYINFAGFILALVSLVILL